MNPQWLLALSAVVWFVTIFAAVSLQRKSIRLMSPEDKIRLVDAFSERHALSGILFVFLIAGTVGGLYFFREFARPIILVALVGVLALSAFSFTAMYRRLRDGGVPEHFLKAFQISRVLRLIGAAGFFGAVVFNFF